MKHQDPTLTQQVAVGSTTRKIGLTVIVVTYGGVDMVRGCLETVMRSAQEVDELVVRVVDNNSPDNTPEMIAAEFPQVILTRSSLNAGFAVANNIALRETTTEYCLLLNPDTLLSDGIIAHSIRQLANDPEIGLYSCRLVTREGVFDHASKRTIPTVRTSLAYFLSKSVPRWRQPTYTMPLVGEYDFADVEAINGAFMMTRMKAVREVGLLDETYWMYGEDLDWCVRFAKAGRRIVYDGRITAVHLKGGSSGRARSPKLNWHFHRSMWVFYRQHVNPKGHIVPAVIWCGIYSRMLAKTIVDLVRRYCSSRSNANRARRTGFKKWTT